MVFRRRGSRGSRGKAPPAEEPTESQAEQDDLAQASAEAERPDGPWDVADAPEDDVARLDLGGLQIPSLPDIEIRLDTDPSGAIISVLLVAGSSALQIGAFAAPRRAGIWEDLRAELLASLRADGGGGEERQGPFGPELVASVPGEQGRQTARFVGVDGPRWFLRGVFTGPAATDPTQAQSLESALREVVVARGGDALPVRDPLPLALPPELQDQADAAGDDAEQAPRAPRRGPEITEIG